MTAENRVDAALSGLDLGKSATLPSVEDYKLWLNFEGARRGLRTVPSNPAIKSCRPYQSCNSYWAALDDHVATADAGPATGLNRAFDQAPINGYSRLFRSKTPKTGESLNKCLLTPHNLNCLSCTVLRFGKTEEIQCVPEHALRPSSW